MIRRLLGCIREYRLVTILTPILVIGEVVLEVYVPYLMANLIDQGIEAGDMNVILRIGLKLLICALGSLAFGIFAGFTAADSACGFAKNLRHDLFENVQRFSFENIDRFSTAGLVTRLTTDVTNVQMAFQMLLRIAVRSPAMLLFSMFMAWQVGGRYSLVYLVAIPVLGIGLFFIIRYVHPIFVRVFQTYDRLNQVVQENVRGIRAVKAFVREQDQVGKFSGVSATIYQDFTRAERILAFNMPLMQFCMFGSILAISWLGGRAIVFGSLTTGELTSLLTYLMQILMSLMMLSMVFVMIIISRASAQRIDAALLEQPTIKNPQNPIMNVKDGSIELTNVNFGYSPGKDQLCLHDVNLSVVSGQTVGILGGTGSGKTTLVQLIPRLFDSSSGSVEIGGVNVRQYDLQTLRDAVAMVLQKNELFSGTIAENLRWGNEKATDGELQEACRVAQADEFIRSFPQGYQTHIEQGGSNVSGGQKQRLCIARALLKHPKILILDDSTSAVDTRTEAQIRSGFADGIQGTTLLIIAQRISSVQHADQIIVMDEGRIVDCGNHEQLLDRCAIYREVYDSQKKGDEEHA